MDRLHCSAFLAMSLDGFIAREDGRVDWLGPFEEEEHGYQAFFDSVDVLVVGRNTYEFVLGRGIRLFQGNLGEIPLRLESVHPFPSGLVQATYRTRPA